jgi:hypothetical protein
MLVCRLVEPSPDCFYIAQVCFKLLVKNVTSCSTKLLIHSVQGDQTMELDCLVGCCKSDRGMDVRRSSEEKGDLEHTISEGSWPITAILDLAPTKYSACPIMTPVFAGKGRSEVHDVDA